MTESYIGGSQWFLPLLFLTACLLGSEWVKEGEVKDHYTESEWVPVGGFIYLIVAAAHQTERTPPSSAAQDCNDTWEDLKGMTPSVIKSGAPSGRLTAESGGAGVHSQVGFISRMASLAWNKAKNNRSETPVQGWWGFTLKCCVKHTVGVASYTLWPLIHSGRVCSPSAE